MIWGKVGYRCLFIPHFKPLNFLYTQILYPIYGTCIVKFIVDSEGNVTGVEATTMRGTKLAEIAVHVIRNGPKWKPAMQYGRPVRAYRLQPVSVTKPN